jgi:hypothetical protein
MLVGAVINAQINGEHNLSGLRQGERAFVFDARFLLSSGNAAEEDSGSWASPIWSPYRQPPLKPETVQILRTPM